MKDDMTQDAPITVKQMLAKLENQMDETDNRFRKPPISPRKAPPPPPHRKPQFEIPEEPEEFQKSELRKSLGPKPKLAPKPLFLNELMHSASTSDLPPTTPTILVSPANSDFSTEFFGESNGNGNGVKNRAKQLENMGFVVPRLNSSASQNERPISQVSTLSQISDEFDEGVTSSDDDTEDVGRNSEGKLRRHRHEDEFDDEISLPLPKNQPKTSMAATTHSEIMDEMKHLFVRNDPNKRVNGGGGVNNQKQQRRQSNVDEIPADVGKLRNNRKGRHNSLFVSPTSGISCTSSDDFSRITSMTTASDRSSIVTFGSGGADLTEIAFPIPDYDTGNEEENQRLKKLHYAAVEFQKVESNYVQYLKEMAEYYPAYMEQFGKKIGKDLLGLHNGLENVVMHIKKVLLQILPLHEMILRELNSKTENWNSENPNMSKTIGTYADFLKCCQPFLDHKAEFMSKLIQMRNEDKDFDEATTMFETEVFKRGKKGAVIQQLDQVHQNFMRYKLLMLRYSEYLVDGTEEKENAKETIERLEQNTQAVNQKMGLPTTEELTTLYDRFQGQFNVLEPGRVLIRQGAVSKQARKEEQPRYLVLFTDCLWLCRTTSSNRFDMGRSSRIPLEYIKFEKMEGDEYVRKLSIRSKVKSMVIIFASEKERNQWAEDLRKAQNDRKLYKRRQSTAVQRQDENRMLIKKLAILNEMRGVSEGSEDVERPGILNSESRRSTSMSESQDDSSPSMPITPCDNGDCPVGFGDRNGSGKKQAAIDVVKPVWLPDHISNECLMEGCSTEFGIINRRHHCRDCGWLICKYCKGQAPLSKFDFTKQNVCSECYDKHHTDYKNGCLFPTRLIVTASDGTIMVKVGKRNDQEIVDPRKLFKPPDNFGFKKRNVDEKRADSLVFGKVYFRTKKSEVVRHALLRRDDLKLVFYKAEFDSKSIMELLIYGYFYREIELENGTLFELIHRNQIRTDDTKDDVISFRVDNRLSAKRWSAAFADKLEVDPSFL